MSNSAESAIRAVWFLGFFIIAWRAHALSGKNLLAAVVAGFGAAILCLTVIDLLGKTGLLLRFSQGAGLSPFLLDCLYLALLPAALVLSRRLLRLRGFGRDFWLVVAFLAPLAWFFLVALTCILITFHPGPV